jgi:hypothetical protein
MTLNLTIVSTWGIWQSSDHRLRDTVTGKLVDDYSIKQVSFRCPDGAALLAYAGVGRVESLDISDWLRETLRGQTRTLDQTFIQIRENATRDLAPRLRTHNILHMFSIGAFLMGRPWAIQIRNFDPAGDGTVLNHFDTVAREVPQGSGLAMAFGGGPGVVSPSDGKKLMTVATRKPRNAKEFRKLLAKINYRAGTTKPGKTFISPGCVTSYIPPAGEPVESEFHNTGRAPGPMIVPMLLFGIDVTEMMKSMKLPSALTSSDDAKLALNQGVEEAGRQSVLSRNRLRRR